MKNFFTIKRTLLLGLVAVLLGACGYVVITSSTLSNKDLKSSQSTFLTSTFQMNEGGGWEGSFHLLYGVRIPENWSAAKVKATIAGNTEVELDRCNNYAFFLQSLFPKDGYKWVGFISAEQQKPFENGATTISAEAELIAPFLVEGNADTYGSFDVIVGANTDKPIKCVKTVDFKRQMNYEEAFGKTFDGKAIAPVTKEINGTSYTGLVTSNYYLSSGTLSKAEKDAAIERLLETTVSITSGEGDAAVTNTYHLFPCFEDADDHDFSTELGGAAVKATPLANAAFTKVNLAESIIMQKQNVKINAEIKSAAIEGVESNEEVYGLLGIRVPADWSSETPICTVVPSGEAIALTPSKAYSDFLEYNLPSEGYKWLGFETEKATLSMVDNHLEIQANLCAGEGMGDFNVDLVYGYSWQNFAETFVTKSTATAQAEDGEETKMDFKNEVAYPVGDLGLGWSRGNLLLTSTVTSEEVERVNADKSKEEVMDFHLARVHKPYNENMQTALAVKVTQNTGLTAIAADSFEIKGDRGGVRVNVKGGAAEGAKVTVYNAQGVMTDAKVVSQGTALLKAHKGVCLVEVSKDGSKAVKKVFVK